MDDLEMGLGLEGSHVLVTGGAGMIGSFVVEAFLRAGALVSVFDLAQVKVSHKNLRSEVVDITNEDQVKMAFWNARQRFGYIVAVVAAAGKDLSFLEHHDSIAHMPVEQFRETLHVNVDGNFLLCREWIRELELSKDLKDLRNKSMIIFGSEAGIFGVDNADYATSKAALHGLVQSLAPEATRYGARVNLVAPGPVDTPQFRKEIQADSAARWVETATSVQGQPVPMSAVARTCLFLASDRYSGSITAQTHRIDGGKSGRLYHPDPS